MKILAVDDELLQLEKLTDSIYEVIPDDLVMGTRRASDALRLADENEFDVAFLDVQMRGMTGVELAQKIQKNQPRINIIFVTAYDDYKADAMDLRASGFITKPVTAEKVRRELENLRYPVNDASVQSLMPAGMEMLQEEPLIYAQCFGFFDVFDKNHNPINFERTKAKEMLAYLIYRQGARCQSRELAALLFEDSDYDLKTQDRFRHVAASMMKALRKIGAEEVIYRDAQSYGINTSLVDCDYYKFLANNKSALRRYSGEFMYQYSWSEYVSGYLDSIV